MGELNAIMRDGFVPSHYYKNYEDLGKVQGVWRFTIRRWR